MQMRVSISRLRRGGDTCMMKLLTVLKIGAAILLAVIDLSRFSSAHADDPAYYKLEDLKELTIYKEADNELRPTFSFETVGFGANQSRVG